MESLEGAWIANPDYRVNHQRTGGAETEKAGYETRFVATKEHVSIMSSPDEAGRRGGRMVFVALAGAEYLTAKGAQGVK